MIKMRGMHMDKKTEYMDNKLEYKDKKTEYIIKTLSRTKRKDYENFVINAIWNRISCEDLKPVTQQYVYNNRENQHYFIDLYFPQLNIGIEVDEAHHSKTKEYDLDRQEAIWHSINKIIVNPNDSYIEYRVQVYDKTFEEIQEQINNTVQSIKEKLNYKNLNLWIIDNGEYVRSIKELTINDDIIFPSMANTCNLIFNCKYKETSGGRRRSYFTPNTFYSDERFKNHKVWFPKLAIENDGLLHAVSHGWNNRLNNDGSIVEFNENQVEVVSHDYIEIVSSNEPLRIVFAQSNDPLGRFGYQFVGIYKKTMRIAIQYDGKYAKAEHYERISKDCPIIR